MSNYSSDLFWELTRNNSSYIVRRGSGTARTTFSKEPLNLLNRHTRKQSGLVNEKAIGVHPSAEKGVTLITKTDNSKNGNKPAKLFNKQVYSKNKSNRKVYQAIVNSTAKHYYRPDLRQDAVSRASAILESQRQKKPTPEAKPRGAKAKKAEA